MVQTDHVFSGPAVHQIERELVGSTDAPLPAPVRPQKLSATQAAKIAKAKAAAAPAAPLTTSEVALLSLLAHHAAPTLSRPDFTPLLQALKSALYNKDYATAFGMGMDDREVAQTVEERRAVETFHEVYAARWVPGRALVYRRLLEEYGVRRLLNTGGNVVALGGGAGSELLALGSLCSTGVAPVNVHVVDSADWGSTLRGQHAALTTTAGAAKMNPTLTYEFHQADVLDVTALSALPLAETKLFTLFFTISELFLQSRAATLKFLHLLTMKASKGTRLLVIESASLGMVPIGSEGREYPLGMMLDHTMELGDQWEVQESEDSRWCRMPAGVEAAYPGIKLENMRVVVRMYRRC